MHKVLFVVVSLILASARADDYQSGEPDASTETAVQTPAASNCYSPKNDPNLAKFLFPGTFKDKKTGQSYSDTEDSIAQIHQMIWDHRNEIDPRLVYYRMLGETDQDPFRTSTAKTHDYGLFQFVGKLYGAKKSQRKTIEAMYAANPGKSARLIQVDYYLNTYLAHYIKAANTPKNKKGTKFYGCNTSKTYSSYTNMEKVTYLGLGACGKKTIKNEGKRCQRGSNQYNVNYANRGACALIGSIGTVPLCNSL